MTDVMLKYGSSGIGVRALQKMLQRTGAQLVVDGQFGRITRDAVKAFQARVGLLVDGIVGPKTLVALSAQPNTKTEPSLDSVRIVAPWLAVARAITGTKEIPGARSNPAILQWVEEIISRYPDIKPNLQWYVNDDTPWCGLENAYVLAKVGHKPAMAPLWALNNGREWVREGSGVELDGPAIGAIVTMKRAGGGHVTLYEGQDDKYWFGRGGNQSNMVNVARFPLSRPLEGFFWPKGHALPEVGPVHVNFEQAIEGSES